MLSRLLLQFGETAVIRAAQKGRAKHWLFILCLIEELEEIVFDADREVDLTVENLINDGRTQVAILLWLGDDPWVVLFASSRCIQ